MTVLRNTLSKAVAIGAAIGCAAAFGLLSLPSSAAASSSAFASGVYAGPASKGVDGARSFDQSMSTASSEVLEFPPMNDWSQIEGQAWLLRDHAAQSARLEYSLPIVPSLPGASLSQCASGAYNQHWQNLARNLVSFKLSGSIIRPGWEMNGNWYPWSAAKSPADYVACFQHVVRTMRQVPGQQFLFDWNPSNGRLSLAAELAYPGDQYVDIIGDDVYDQSWTWYSATHAPSAEDQRKAVAYELTGDHALGFWAGFARSHGKALALTEWGLSHLSDGHGGEDNPQFIQAMYQFMANPLNHVLYHHYFNVGGHVITGATLFPRAAATFRTLFGRSATPLNRRASFRQKIVQRPVRWHVMTPTLHRS
jgi:hypothetical protein